MELVRHDWKHGGQSELLVVDTHTSRGRPTESLRVQPPLRAPAPHPHTPVLAGVSASLATFALVLAVFSWRWRGLRGQNKLVEEPATSSHIYRGQFDEYTYT